MAIVHKATISPTKGELIDAWLDGRPWCPPGEVELLGSYRFDDPAGEVGVEAIIVRRGGRLLHVPLTYRGAPLPGGESAFICTMQHSALGKRWIYDATGDPVALHCFVRALRGEQQQAGMELWDGDKFIGRREPTARVFAEPGDTAAEPSADVAVVEVDGAELRLAHVIGTELTGPRQLVAEWADGRGVVAALV
jgi:maltokinase-like protein